MADAVVDGVSGVLVAPNSPDAVAVAAVRLLSDPVLRARLGRDGRALVEQNLNWGPSGDRNHTHREHGHRRVAAASTFFSRRSDACGRPGASFRRPCLTHTPERY